jgi:hypothetical protein
MDDEEAKSVKKKEKAAEYGLLKRARERADTIGELDLSSSSSSSSTKKESKKDSKTTKEAKSNGRPSKAEGRAIRNTCMAIVIDDIIMVMFICCVFIVKVSVKQQKEDKKVWDKIQRAQAKKDRDAIAAMEASTVVTTIVVPSPSSSSSSSAPVSSRERKQNELNAKAARRQRDLEIKDSERRRDLQPVFKLVASTPTQLLAFIKKMKTSSYPRYIHHHTFVHKRVT